MIQSPCRLLMAGIAAWLLVVGGAAHAGDKAPDFVLEDKAGNMVSLKEFRGKPLVLHFWATWCPYCKKLQPGLQALQDRYAGSKLVVVAISFREDEGSDPQGVLQKRGHTFVTLLDGDDVAAMYGVRGTPTTFFIDRKGRVVGMTNASDPKDPVLNEMAVAITQ